MLRKQALFLLSTMSLILSLEVPLQISVTVAELGDNVTLICDVSGQDLGLFFWYKMDFGASLQTIVMGSFENIRVLKPFHDQRISFTKVGHVHFLTIRNVSKEDQSTYFCQAGPTYHFDFYNGTVLTVNDPKNDLTVRVKQSRPDSDLLGLDGSVTLQCSLHSEHREHTDQCERTVYWFKSASESHPGILYTDGACSDEEDEGEKQRCFHHLSKTIKDPADAGTYYCAVVTCAEILFGKGIPVEPRQNLLPFVFVLGTLLACCVIVIISLILTVNHFYERKGAVPVSIHAEQDKPEENQSSALGDEMTEVNYAAVNFSSRQAIRWTKRDTSGDCLYSNTRNHQ